MHRGYGGTPGGKRPTGRPRRIRENNNKMRLQEVVWRVMGWTDLAQDRER